MYFIDDDLLCFLEILKQKFQNIKKILKKYLIATTCIIPQSIVGYHSNRVNILKGSLMLPERMLERKHDIYTIETENCYSSVLKSLVSDPHSTTSIEKVFKIFLKFWSRRLWISRTCSPSTIHDGVGDIPSSTLVVTCPTLDKG